MTSIVLGFAMMGSLFFLVQFLQNVQGYTAFETGLRTLPTSVSMFVVAPFVGRLMARIGPRPLILLGALFAATSLFWIAATLQPDASYALLWWQIALFGIGCGFMMTPLTAAVLAATPQERSGLGSSLLNTSRQVGITLGVAVLGAIVSQQFPENIAAQLTQHGLPTSTSATMAKQLAAGHQAFQAGHLFPATVLHHLIGQAFVDALRATFFISAIGLLVSAVLVVFFLRRAQPARVEVPVLYEAPAAHIPQAGIGVEVIE